MNRNILIPVLLVGVLAVGGAAVTNRIRGGSADKTQYKIAKSELGQVKKTVSATGTLQPWKVVDIKSKAGGRIDSLLVDVGSEVKQGQIMVKIDPSDTLLSVDQARADIDSARARVTQSGDTYQLQIQQSRIAIENARAAYDAALANQSASRSRLETARSQAKAQPSLTRAAINSAAANLRNAQQMLQQLNSTHAQERASARAAYDQAVANRDNAVANLKRQQSLLAKQFVAPSAVDQAQANAGVAVASVATADEKLKTIDAQQEADQAATEARAAQARAQLENARAQSVDVVNKQQAVDQAVAAYKQATAQAEVSRAALDQAVANQASNGIKKLDINQAQASVNHAAAAEKNAMTTLDQTVVRAPSTGVILKKYVEQGTIITSGLSLSSTGTSIVQLGDITRQYVDVTVDETDIANVDDGQAVDVTIEAYPGITFEGKVARIDPQAEVVQNVTTFHVRVEMDN